MGRPQRWPRWRGRKFESHWFYLLKRPRSRRGRKRGWRGPQTKESTLKCLLKNPDERAASRKVNVNDVNTLVRHGRLVEHGSLVLQEGLVNFGRINGRLLHAGVVLQSGAVGLASLVAWHEPWHGQVFALGRRSRLAPERFQLLWRLEVSVDHRSAWSIIVWKDKSFFV